MEKSAVEMGAEFPRQVREEQLGRWQGGRRWRFK